MSTVLHVPPGGDDEVARLIQRLVRSGFEPGQAIGAVRETPTIDRRSDMSTYPPTAKVESKVKASTVGAYLGFAALLYVLQLVLDQPELLTPLPDVIEPLVLGTVPALVTFVAGYRARHTSRG